MSWDILDAIDQITQHGCPNCRETSGLQHRIVTTKQNPALVRRSVQCLNCSITWESDPIPAREL
jgi:hypothetical protein